MALAGAELTYRLPFEATESFPFIFEQLDSQREEFGIKTYGISVTTLEEVFLKIGHTDFGDDKTDGNPTKNVDSARGDDDDDEKGGYVSPTHPVGDEEDGVVDADKNPFEQPTFQVY